MRTSILSAVFVTVIATSVWASPCAEEGTFGAITFKTEGEYPWDTTCVATIDASGEDDFIVEKDYTVDKIVFSRAFKAYQHQTIVLPISFYKSGFIDGGSVFEISELAHYSKYEPWQIVCKETKPENMKANTPYIMQAYQNDGITIATNNGGSITIHKTSSKDNPVFRFADNWEFRGTYTYKKWGEGDSQIGHVYGFAANSKDKVQAGQFVKVKAGAFIKPLRAYLYYDKKSSSGTKRPAANGVNGMAAIEDDDLPSTIDVVFKDENGETTSIGRMNTVTGEISAATGWFDMKGRRLSKKPTQKGTYFNNGKKVVIK
ncbi:MAG: hypothetical protein MJY99_12105 [Fibrobacter sp.]|nr:hypothetical protein [Fibrobacter sp.]